MGVEGGPSGGGIGGSVASAVSVGPAIGPAVSVGLPGIVNEGPVRGSLEGFRPMNISDIKTIDNGGTIGTSILEQAEAVAAKAWEASVLPTSAQAVSQAETIISQVVAIPDITPVKPGVLPWVEPVPAIQVSPASKTEIRVSYQAAPTISPQPLLQEQEVKEEVLEQVNIEDSTDVLKEEEELEIKKYVEDIEVSVQRKYEIRKAVIKAKAEAVRLGLKGIAGWLVAKFLPAEHAGNRSQIVKKNGPDGSYQETVEEVAGAGELASEQSAVKRFDAVVNEKKPVKYGKEGVSVAQKDVARVFKYRFIKPSVLQEVVVKRIIKKKVLQPLAQVVDAKVETTLKDYPDLAEVFSSKAA